VLSALVIGLIAGAASALLTLAVYASEDSFRKLPIHWVWWPAIGGLVIGVGGLLQPRALGVGYNSIDSLLLAQLGLTVVLSLIIVKAAIWSISLGSGTSGGVLAPLLIMGGALGALLAFVLPGGSPSLFVLVGMGAMIGGTMRAPFTGAVFSLELTHDFNALLPLLVAALAADAFTVLVMKRSILTEKVARRGVHVAREYGIDPLERIVVRDVARTDVQPMMADLPVEELLRASADPDAGEVGISLVDGQGRYVGFLSRLGLKRYVELGGDPNVPGRSLVLGAKDVCYPDEPMRIAADRLASLDGMALPVVDPDEPSRVVGFVTRESPFEARVLWTELERRQERHLNLPAPARAWRWLRNRARDPEPDAPEEGNGP
jgi:chloride channel protein, CIC family